MALYVLRGGHAPPPDQKHRAELMSFLRFCFPCQKEDSVIQKFLLKFSKIVCVLRELIETVLGHAQTNR